jgi:hypothetical protein
MSNQNASKGTNVYDHFYIRRLYGPKALMKLPTDGEVRLAIDVSCTAFVQDEQGLLAIFF